MKGRREQGFQVLGQREILPGAVRFRGDSACPYFQDGRTATLEYVFAGDVTGRDFGALLEGGYRRIANVFYRTACGACDACIPLRLDVGLFVPSRGQIRTERENRDLSVEVSDPAVMTPEKVSLYSRYLRARHPDGERSDDEQVTALSLIHKGYDGTLEMDYYLGKTLVGVGIVDVAQDAMSSNYFYYDTRFLKRRPGIFSILKEIALAREMGKRFYHLGFCIEETSNMAYKRSFRPNQILVHGRWRDFLVGPQKQGHHPREA